ncbi:MAG: glycosyltransferase family 4 protein [Sedimentisphaerales bacterium]|nr:glycosyltransferase family 4 protein [Sedimentisphaerales bacterium]
MVANVGLVPDCRHGLGGPSSFQRKLHGELSKRGLKPCYDLEQGELDVLMVINATRHLPYLWRAKSRGVPIIQRLGAPFLSSTHLDISWALRMRAWLGMRNIVHIRAHIADRIVYQSRFVKECWDRLHGETNKPSRVIYNGVDLSRFSPNGPRYVSKAEVCIISVEGTQRGPDDHPALALAQSLRNRGVDIELLLFGRPFGNTGILWKEYPFVQLRGVVPNDDLPFFYRGSTLYLLTDIVNAGCPNSVIEALACGAPVLGYALSVLPEMLDPSAGRCVPAVGDPWKGVAPGNLDVLLSAALEMVADNLSFRAGARRLAETRYGLTHMVDRYVDFFSQ